MSSRTTITTPAEILTFLGKGANATDAEWGLVNMLQPMAESAVRTFLGYEVVQNTYTHLLPDIDLFSISQHDIGQPIDVVNNRISYAFPGPPVILQVPQIPLRAVTSLYADYSALGGQGPNTDFPSNTLQVQGTDYYVDFDSLDTGSITTGISWTGHLRRWIGVWPARQRCIKITYTAGITPDELDGKTAFPVRRVTDIKYAALLTCAAAYHEAKAWQGNGIGATGPIVSEKIGDAAFTYHDSIAQITAMQTQIPWKAQLLLMPHQRVKR